MFDRRVKLGLQVQVIEHLALQALEALCSEPSCSACRN